MGLTHSWLRPTELPAEKFAAAVRDLRKVLEHVGVPLAGFEGHGDPVLTDEAIVFNGAGRARCEAFEIHQVEFDRQGRSEKFSFCKTERLPYDLAVKAALIVLRKNLGEAIKIMSDEPDEAWLQARQLVDRTTGFGFAFKLDAKT